MKKIECPTCRREVELTKGVEDLLCNFAMSAAVDAYKLKSGGALPCEDCEEHPSSHRCNDCNYYMCDECCTIHRRMKLSRGHTVFTLAEYESQGTAVAKPSYCLVHKERKEMHELTLCCKTCDFKPICMACAVLGHCRPEHDYGSITEHIGAQTEEVAAMLAEVNTRAEFIASAVQQISDVKQKVVERQASAHKELKGKYEFLYDTIRAREKATRDQISAIALQKQKMLTSQSEVLTTLIAALRSSATHAQRTLEHGSAAEIMLSKPMLLQRLQELQQQQEECAPAATADIWVDVEQEELLQAVARFGESYIPTASSEHSTAEGAGLGAEVGVNEAAVFTVELKDVEGGAAIVDNPAGDDAGGAGQRGVGMLHATARVVTLGEDADAVGGAVKGARNAEAGPNYAALDLISNLRGGDGKLEMKLSWPGSDHAPQHWRQTSNPYEKRSRGVEGYEAISCPHSEYGWGGLQWDMNNAVLSGSSADGGGQQGRRFWFYAVGAWTDYGGGGGIPGPVSEAVQRVQLEVKDHASGGWVLVMRQEVGVEIWSKEIWLNENDPTEPESDAQDKDTEMSGAASKAEAGAGAGAGASAGAGAGAGAAAVAPLPPPPEIEIIGTGESVYACQYTPTFAGVLEISVCVMGKHVAGSPFLVRTTECTHLGLLRSKVYRDHICSWITGPAKKLELLYRGTEHGWRTADFLRMCNNQGPTVTVVQVGAHLFGGYTSRPWTGGGSWQQPEQVFLFRLTDGTVAGAQPVMLPCKDPSHGVHDSSSYGPSFGSGHGLSIKDDAGNNSASYSDVTSSFTLPAGHTGEEKTFLAGIYQFTPSEVEVFAWR
jgi:hypothetical protein